MSTLENTELEERLMEAFDLAMEEDDELVSTLAHSVLGVWNMVPSENLRSDVDFAWIYMRVLQEFNKSEGTTMDIRSLCESAFDIDLGKEKQRGEKK